MFALIFNVFTMCANINRITNYWPLTPTAGESNLLFGFSDVESPGFDEAAGRGVFSAA